VPGVYRAGPVGNKKVKDTPQVKSSSHRVEPLKQTRLRGGYVAERKCYIMSHA